MRTYISLLRGINVGGRLVDMGLLKEIFNTIGAEKVETYLRSGNVIFESSENDTSALMRKIERELEKRLGFKIKAFVKTVDELRNVVDRMPLGNREGDKLHVTFLSATPVNFPSKEVDSVKGADEEYAYTGNEIYLYCPGGYGRTRLSNNYFERKLKVDATTRNWRSVNALLSTMDARMRAKRGEE